MVRIKPLQIACLAAVSLLPALSIAADGQDDSESNIRRLGIRLGATLALGQATISDSAHFATDLGLILGAEFWLTRHLGVGARAAGEIWTPWLAQTNLYHRFSVLIFPK